MARLPGPDEGSREVRALIKGVFYGKADRPVQLWADPAGTVPADVLDTSGALIPHQQPANNGGRGMAPTTITDSNSFLTDFLFPDDVDKIYGTCDGGPAWPIYARTDSRFDALETQIDMAALRTANLSDLADVAVARLNLGVTVDAPAGTGSLRTLGTGAQQAAPGNDSRFGLESLPVSSGATWSGVINTSLANTARTVHATLTGNLTLNLPVPSATVSYTVTLVLTQDATGGRTLTLPGCRFAYGVAPVLSTAGGATDVLHLMWTGVQWIALMGAPAVA